MGILDKIFGTYSDKELKRIEPIKEKVLSLEEKYKSYSDSELAGETVRFSRSLPPERRLTTSCRRQAPT